MQTILRINDQLWLSIHLTWLVFIHPRRTVAGFRGVVDRNIERTGYAGVAQVEMWGLVVVVVGCAAVEGGGEVKGEGAVGFWVVGGGAF